ncbi:MAG: lysophospholipid acyltransferase family protein [Christensenellales bacterium]|nr:lysophospholipid acyltransferase family protein [Christensenellales bacterium]
MFMGAYRFLLLTCRPFYLLFRPAKVFGLENLPLHGGFLLCANHQHWLDPVHICAHVPQRKYRFLAKAEAFRGRFPKWFLSTGVGCIPIHRGATDLSAVRTVISALSEGNAIGIFPQGTRSRDNTPTPMQNGVSLIAVRSGAPIVPVYIEGPYRLFRRNNIHIGAPVDISDVGRRCDSDTLQDITHRIEQAIWSMGGVRIPRPEKS